MVSIFKLETLKELFRVNFPDSKLIDDSCDDGQVQQHLGICGHITNRGEQYLAKRLINRTNN
jgi:hypothetical protein